MFSVSPTDHPPATLSGQVREMAGSLAMVEALSNKGFASGCRAALRGARAGGRKHLASHAGVGIVTECRAKPLMLSPMPKVFTRPR